MIEDVEDFCSQLQFYVLTPVELPAQRQVQLRHAKTSERVVTQRALSDLRRHHERCPIESSSAGYCRIAQVKRNAGNQVGTLEFEDEILSHHLRSDDDIHGRGGASPKDSINRPIAQRFVNQGITLRRGQVVRSCGGQRVAHIEIRRATTQGRQENVWHTLNDTEPP